MLVDVPPLHCILNGEPRVNLVFTWMLNYTNLMEGVECEISHSQENHGF